MNILNILSKLFILPFLIVTLQAKEVSLENKITSLYVSFFNRAADKSGLDYWHTTGTNVVASGGDSLSTLKELSAGFATHPTFFTTYNSMNNGSFVQAIYQNSLGREGDSQGVAYWKGLLDDGKSRSDMVAEFMELSLTLDLTVENFPDLSSEDLAAAQERQNLITNKVTVAVEFTNKLGERTNVVNTQNPESDTAYMASVKVIADVNIEATSVSDAIEKITTIANDNNAISRINNDWDNIELTSDLVPSDEPYYKYLWHIDSQNSRDKQIAQEMSNVFNNEFVIEQIDPHADINILEAWKITYGKGVVVAVIDDGADIRHEDLKENILLTYNADNDSKNVDNLSNDINYALHGNTCAGFISAPINDVGTIGTAPKSKLIAIKLEGSGDIETIRAFEYAKNNGAKVVSCSWGTEAVSEAVEAVIKSLYDAGITVLFASGNEGKTLDSEGLYDESELEWVIGVGASGENNDVTSYSNYGENIDILSPGGDVELSVGLLGLDDTGTQGSTDNFGLVSDSYVFTNGTSFSTPIAAGVVALMYSVNPTITPQEVRDILVSTADKIGDNHASYINGFDQKRAYGKINAYKAVSEASK